MQQFGTIFRTRKTSGKPRFVVQLDLFPEALADSKGKTQRRVLMHVADAGDGEHGGPVCLMACRACGARTGWLRFDSISQAKRGMPCAQCNGAPASSSHR